MTQLAPFTNPVHRRRRAPPAAAAAELPASPTGAASTPRAAIALTITATGALTPAPARHPPQLPRLARDTRCLAASSLTPIASPTSAQTPTLEVPQHERRPIRRAQPRQRRVDVRRHLLPHRVVILAFSLALRDVIAAAFRSCFRCRANRRSAASAVHRVAATSHPAGGVRLAASDAALRASSTNTACVTSSARCRSRTCRTPREYTRSTYLRNDALQRRGRRGLAYSIEVDPNRPLQADDPFTFELPPDRER
jgi:hypothetical protein